MPTAPYLVLLKSQNTVSRTLRSVAAAAVVCAAALSSPPLFAASADLDTIYKLLEQGKANDAAKQVQAQLKRHPDDMQLRFLQGLIATEQKKYDQAISIFRALTQDYPHLPEPYNNLAVLYSTKGDDQKAAQALEQAIRTNASYATAHQNLGDLYARMASDAYAKALQLDSGHQAAQPKLALIKQVAAVAQKPASATASAAQPVAVAPAPAPVTPAPNVAKEAEAPQPVAEPLAPKVVEPAKAPEKPASTSAESKAVEAAVHAWARAWAQQDINAYYAAYSPKFDPPGSSLAAWKAERKNRIVGRSEITVDVHDLKVSVQGDQATASFRQYYASGSYKASTRKTLRLRQEGGKWRIFREEAGR